jgi:hypothetical protein
VVEVLQKGEPVPTDATWKGPIRVRFPGGGLEEA